jgi:hypothetical protein
MGITSGALLLDDMSPLAAQEPNDEPGRPRDPII